MDRAYFRDMLTFKPVLMSAIVRSVNSDLDSAEFRNSKFIAKLSTDVATSALLNKIVIEVNYRGRSFEVIQSAIDVNAIF